MNEENRDLDSITLPTSSKFLLAGAIALTVIWLLGALYLGFHPSSLAKPPEKINEWGDFAAGVSAPIAFLWLVLAVILQSTELKEQRREIALTRREYEHNREVMTAQANEARRQAEYIEQQTRMHLEDRAHAASLEVYTASIDLVATRLRQYSNAWEIYLATPNGKPDTNNSAIFGISRTTYNDLTDQLVIARTVQTVRTQLRNLREHFAGSRLAAVYSYDFERISSAVISSAETISKLPESVQIKAKTLELDELKSQIIFINNLLPARSFFSKLTDG
ncbi:hypothetical protein [Rhizobium sp. P44RR-XXIV]|uniref:hypothetical protein n=1 Tax=Rhizobium sp. P44RR-XXIV TaxID=1921145 RepID=UPI0009851ABB|nr:hypothetical protein [Rhizobium sp. P44RR-XXIV]TIX89603.1 hypothetical protein BSK43_023965 [Rhizobium sp. P44RR-XXIV]